MSLTNFKRGTKSDFAFLNQKKPPKPTRTQSSVTRTQSESKNTRLKSALKRPKSKTIFRSLSTQNNQAPGAQEDATQILKSLKIDYNSLKEENMKYRTRNAQLETLINTLYDDLHEQKEQIELIHAGKSSLKSEFLQSSLALGLKRQIREERTINKMLSDEVDQLKKQIKFTQQEELLSEVKVFQAECIRLRKQLTKELKKDERNIKAVSQTHFNLLHQIANDEDRRNIANQLAKKDSDLHEMTQKYYHTKNDLESTIKAMKKQEQAKDKFNSDLQAKQNFLIKAKGDQIKILQEQQSSQAQKIANYDRVNQRNKELTLQVINLQNQIIRLEKQLKQLQEQPSTPLIRPFLENSIKKVKSKEDLSPQKDSTLQLDSSLVKQKTTPEQSKQIKTLAKRTEEVLQSLVPQSNLISSQSSLVVSDMFFKKQKKLSHTELVCRGLKNFKALMDETDQPNSDIEQAFYKEYEKDILKLYNLLQSCTINQDLLEQVLSNKIEYIKTSSLQDQVMEVMHEWSKFAEEVLVCKLALKHIIPSIKNDQIDLTKLYDGVKVLLDTYSYKSKSHQSLTNSNQNYSEIVSEDNEKQMKQQLESIDTVIAPIQQNIVMAQPVVQVISFVNNISSYKESHFEQDSSMVRDPIDHVNNGPSNSQSEYSEVRSEMQRSKSITEDQMLDMAEQILTMIAQKLVQSSWTVQDVFGQPDEIIQVIPEYNGETDIKVLKSEMFLARIYQVGIQDLTQLQVACLMKVLGKPEFDDSIRYSELEQLLENFGVLKSIIKSEEVLFVNEAQSESETIEKHSQMSDGILFIDQSRPHFTFDKKSSVARSVQSSSINKSITSEYEDKLQNSDYFKQMQEQLSRSVEKQIQVKPIQDQSPKKSALKQGPSQSTKELRQIKKTASIDDYDIQVSELQQNKKQYPQEIHPQRKKSSGNNVQAMMPNESISETDEHNQIKDSFVNEEHKIKSALKNTQISNKSNGQNDKHQTISLSLSGQNEQSSDQTADHKIKGVIKVKGQKGNVMQLVETNLLSKKSDQDSQKDSLVIGSESKQKSKFIKIKDDSNLMLRNAQISPQMQQLLNNVESTLKQRINNYDEKLMSPVNEEVSFVDTYDFDRKNKSKSPQSNYHKVLQSSLNQQHKQNSNVQKSPYVPRTTQLHASLKSQGNFEQKKSNFASLVANEIEPTDSRQENSHTMSESQIREMEELKANLLKEPQKTIRLQIVQDNLPTQIGDMIRDILTKIELQELNQLFEKQGQLQSGSDKQVITSEAFFQLINAYTQINLDDSDKDLLLACVQLSPQYNDLYSIEHLLSLFKEIQVQALI